MRNRLKILQAVILCLCLTAAVCQAACTGEGAAAGQEQEGRPDAVSSMSKGTRCRLNVVANTDFIDDRTEFACEVARMCRDNSFRTIRFSTDMGGLPDELDITVYLKKADIGRQKPVMYIYLKAMAGGYEVCVDGKVVGKV